MSNLIPRRLSRTILCLDHLGIHCEAKDADSAIRKLRPKCPKLIRCDGVDFALIERKPLGIELHQFERVIVSVDIAPIFAQMDQLCQFGKSRFLSVPVQLGNFVGGSVARSLKDERAR